MPKKIRTHKDPSMLLPLTSRRRFMKMAGLLGSAAFLPSALRAQEASVPKRLLVVFSGGGPNPRGRRMRPPGAPAAWSEYDLYDYDQFQSVPDELEFEFDLASLSQADFSPALRPLHRHRNKMIVTEGLAYTSTRREDGDAHAQAHLACLTGAYGAYVFDGVKCHASHPSIDQLVSDHLALSEFPLHRAEAFTTAIYGGRHEYNPFHSAFYRWTDSSQSAVSRVPFGHDVVSEYNRIFRGVSSETPNPIEQSQSDVLNAVSSHYDSLLNRLSSVDRQRLSAHRQLVFELQQSLDQPRPSGCQVPTEPGAPAANIDLLYEQDLNTWMDMAVAAFSCDLTRVISIADLWNRPNSYLGFDNGFDWHHGIDHGSSPHLLYDPTATDYATKAEANTLSDAHQAEWVAQLCDRLDSIPEANGTTMLDNTLVFWVRELSHGDHGHENLHTVMLGGLGGHFNTGRYIKYAQANPNPWQRNYNNYYTGTSYNRLLVSIVQAFGLTQNQMGTVDTRYSDIPFRNIQGTVDMRGPLDRLRA